MKRNFIYTILLLSLISIDKICAQQEFFGNSNGLTLSLGNGNGDYKYTAADIYIKDNLIISGFTGNQSGQSIKGLGINFFSTREIAIQKVLLVIRLPRLHTQQLME